MKKTPITNSRPTGYLVQVENFLLPFDLKEHVSTREHLPFCYYQEDVLGSGFDDIMFMGIKKKVVDKFVKDLIKWGVPKDQITVCEIRPIG